MRKNYLVIIMAVLFLATLVSPVLAAPWQQGRPDTLDSAGNSGYYIWQEGTRWNMRTVSFGAPRHYTGTIESDGLFTDVSAQPNDRGERTIIKVRNEKIDFNFNSSTRNDGLSFNVNGGQNVRFKLFMDGQAVNSSYINIGNASRHPDTNEFSLRMNSDSYNEHNNKNFSDNNNYNHSPNKPYDPNGSYRLRGQPMALNPGNLLGYFIWTDGDRWVLKTTTQGSQRHFTGTIRTNGTFTDFSRKGLEGNDHTWINNSGNELGFDMKTSRVSEGFSFRLNNSASVTYSLFIDGQAVNSEDVYIGRQDMKPHTNPFTLSMNTNQYAPGDTSYYPGNNRSYGQLNSDEVRGQPTSMMAGNSFGYYIWQDRNRWYLETTTTGNERQFSGVIETDRGISDVQTMHSLRSEGDTVDSNNSRINFTFRTGGSGTGISLSLPDGLKFNQPDKVSGLSFLASEGATLNFTLYIDGQSVDPSNVYLGNANRHPYDNSLKITSHNEF